MMPVTVVLFNIVLTQALQIFLSTLPSMLLLLESITEVPHWEVMDKLSFLFSVREVQHHQLGDNDVMVQLMNSLQKQIGCFNH